MNIRRVVLFLFLLTAVGCQQLDDSYSTYRGKSINGIQVFVQLLREKGHRVDVWPALNETLYSDYEQIIIFNDSFTGMEKEAVEEVWGLAQYGEASKILYVGRDLDLTSEYWDSVAQQLRKEGEVKKADRAAKEAVEARLSTISQLSKRPEDEESKWFFDLEPSAEGIRDVNRLTRFDADGEKQSDLPCHWPVYRTMIPPEDSIALWETSEKTPQPILIKTEYEMTDVYSLSSGYPLLNGALMNSENQKLVDALIEQLDISGNIAVVRSSRFLPLDERQGSWEFLKVFPHPWIVAHFFLFVALFCLSKYPIFGRPRQQIPHDVKRFGAHIEAIADLLRRTKRRDFAFKQIQTWHDQQTKHRRRGANR